MSDVSHPSRTGITARALLLGDRIDTIGLERNDVLSTQPLAFRTGNGGIVALFRYGVAVLIGMSALEEDEVIRQLAGRITRPAKRREEESTRIEISPDKDEQILPGGAVVLKALTNEHALLIADALATSVILAHDERNVAAVFDSIEPLARELAERRRPAGRRSILKHIGNALLVQQRVSGLVAVAEKPDVLWERPDLERVYARLEDEYELKGARRRHHAQAYGDFRHRQGARRHHRYRTIAAAGGHHRRAHPAGNLFHDLSARLAGLLALTPKRVGLVRRA